MNKFIIFIFCVLIYVPLRVFADESSYICKNIEGVVITPYSVEEVEHQIYKYENKRFIEFPYGNPMMTKEEYKKFLDICGGILIPYVDPEKTKKEKSPN